VGSPCRSANRISKKYKEKEILEKGLDGCFCHNLRGEINLYVSSKVTRCTMSASCVVVELSWRSLAVLCTALLEHAERLEDLLRPSWLNAEEIGNEMNRLVDTLMVNGVDQKWFSGYAQVEGVEVMLTSLETHAVSLGFCLSTCDNVLTIRIFAITPLQAA
jgi:hypothetical protein